MYPTSPIVPLAVAPDRLGVSVIHFRVLLGMVELEGFDPNELLKRCGLNQEMLSAAGNYASWELYLGLLEQAADYMGRERLLAATSHFAATIPDVGAMARRFTRPHALMKFIVDVIDRAAAPIFEYGVEAISDREFLLHEFARDGYEFTPLFRDYTLACSRIFPTYLGLPLAEVCVMESYPNGHRTLITWPSEPVPSELPPLNVGADAVLRVLSMLGVDVLQLLAAGYESLEQQTAENERMKSAMQVMLADFPNPAFMLDEQFGAQALNQAAERAKPALGPSLTRSAATSSAGASSPVSGAPTPAGDYSFVPFGKGRQLAVLKQPLVTDSHDQHLCALLGLIPVPAALLLQGGRVLSSNGRLYDALTQCKELRVTPSGWSFLSAANTSLAQQAFASCEQASEKTLQPLSIPLSTATQSLTAILVPLSGTSEPTLLLLAHGAASNIRVDAQLVSAIFELTPAEAQVTVGLAEGLQLQEIAEQRGSSIHTVRTLSKRIFMKTGTRTQADLVRLVLSNLVVHLLSSSD